MAPLAASIAERCCRVISVQWQPSRHKHLGETVDDMIRPFSVEVELSNGEKVLCEVRPLALLPPLPLPLSAIYTCICYSEI
jgi:hypothetical protein